MIRENYLIQWEIEAQTIKTPDPCHIHPSKTKYVLMHFQLRDKLGHEMSPEKFGTSAGNRTSIHPSKQSRQLTPLITNIRLIWQNIL